MMLLKLKCINKLNIQAEKGLGYFESVPSDFGRFNGETQMVDRLLLFCIFILLGLCSITLLSNAFL